MATAWDFLIVLAEPIRIAPERETAAALLGMEQDSMFAGQLLTGVRVQAPGAFRHPAE